MQDVRKRKLVRNEIVNNVVEHVAELYRGVGNPSMSLSNQLVLC